MFKRNDFNGHTARCISVVLAPNLFQDFLLAYL